VSSGYNITNYHNFHKVDRPCILRHDVDFDVNKALDFANRESKIGGFQSTYFFLVSSDFYNMFAKSTLDVLERILKLGHEVGLHFDEVKYLAKKNVMKLVDCVEEELYLLGRILGKPIKVVSMHRPSKFTLENDLKLQNAINSYSKVFTNDFKYVSDSRMNWREDVVEIIQSKMYERLHILSHPFWYSDKEQTTRDKIISFINRSKLERYRSISENFRDIEEFVRLEDVNGSSFE
jgi:peptidoglycan/xylan/chitin deacetylase (PgdA/CDA1 family)